MIVHTLHTIAAPRMKRRRLLFNFESTINRLVYLILLKYSHLSPFINWCSPPEYQGNLFLGPLSCQIQQILKSRSAGAQFKNTQDERNNPSFSAGNPFSSLLIFSRYSILKGMTARSKSPIQQIGRNFYFSGRKKRLWTCHQTKPMPYS